jgi:phosphoribosylformylglycinamidine (FGAM) synthase-like enzyme
MVGHLNVCSREWVIRQYDHEVQGGTIVKPLQGVRHDGPGDACVIWPHAATGDMEDFACFAVGHGLNPDYGRIDPYYMALAAVDEALRNLTCVGADPARAALGRHRQRDAGQEQEHRGGKAVDEHCGEVPVVVPVGVARPRVGDVGADHDDDGDAAKGIEVGLALGQDRTS